MKYKRILLKLSGEALMGDNQYGIDPNRLSEYAQEIKKIHDLSINNLVVSDKNTLNYTENKDKVDDVTHIKHKKNSR